MADGTLLGEQTLAEAMRRWVASQAAANTAPSGAAPPNRERMREQQRGMSYHLAEAVVRA
jgi:hypothetical protein